MAGVVLTFRALTDPSQNVFVVARRECALAAEDPIGQYDAVVRRFEALQGSETAMRIARPLLPVLQNLATVPRLHEIARAYGIEAQSEPDLRDRISALPDVAWMVRSIVEALCTAHLEVLGRAQFSAMPPELQVATIRNFDVPSLRRTIATLSGEQTRLLRNDMLLELGRRRTELELEAGGAHIVAAQLNAHVDGASRLSQSLNALAAERQHAKARLAETLRRTKRMTLLAKIESVRKDRADEKARLADTLTRFESLLFRNPDLDARGSVQGASLTSPVATTTAPLVLAIMLGELRMAQRMLDNGPDVNAPQPAEMGDRYVFAGASAFALSVLLFGVARARLYLHIVRQAGPHSWNAPDLNARTVGDIREWVDLEVGPDDIRRVAQPIGSGFAPLHLTVLQGYDPAAETFENLLVSMSL